MPPIELIYVASLPLKHQGDCYLLGVTSDFMIYAEEIYSADAWVGQHILQVDGKIIETVDEDYGKNRDLTALALPSDIARPKPGWNTKALNYLGPRHRGLREPERVQNAVRTLSIEAKMMVADLLGSEITPPMILGLAESYVLAEAEIVRPNLYIVCRRIRIAYALPQVMVDDDNQPYDYDTVVLYAAHLYNREFQDDVSLEEALTGLPGAKLTRPMDCLIYQNHIFVGDGGTQDTPSTIHIWQVKNLTTA